MRAAAALALAVILTACQSTPPPVADAGKPMTVGDWTVKTSGYVRAEASVVHD
jgi:hypothetical protein